MYKSTYPLMSQSISSMKFTFNICDTFFWKQTGKKALINCVSIKCLWHDTGEGFPIWNIGLIRQQLDWLDSSQLYLFWYSGMKYKIDSYSMKDMLSRPFLGRLSYSDVEVGQLILDPVYCIRGIFLDTHTRSKIGERTTWTQEWIGKSIWSYKCNTLFRDVGYYPEGSNILCNIIRKGHTGSFLEVESMAGT